MNGLSQWTADVILANTCSVRDNAEQRIWGRIEVFHKQKEKDPASWWGLSDAWPKG